MAKPRFERWFKGAKHAELRTRIQELVTHNEGACRREVSDQILDLWRSRDFTRVDRLTLAEVAGDYFSIFPAYSKSCVCSHCLEWRRRMTPDEALALLRERDLDSRDAVLARLAAHYGTSQKHALRHHSLGLILRDLARLENDQALFGAAEALTEDEDYEKRDAAHAKERERHEKQRARSHAIRASYWNTEPIEPTFDRIIVVSKDNETK